MAPGALAEVTGQVEKWPVPTPKFARDPAPAPDGSIFIAMMNGNRIARFNPATGKIDNFDMGATSKPRRMAVGPDGMLWVTFYGWG